MIRTCASILSLCIGAAPVQAGDMAVKVIHKGDDLLGKRLVFRLKEEVRRSTQFFLTDSADVYVAGLHILTASPGQADQRMAIYSATLLLRDPKDGAPDYCAPYLGYAETERVDEAAVDLLVWFSEQLDRCRTE